MGKRTGKPGPDPRLPIEKESVRPFGGPSRPPLKEVAKREERSLENFNRKVRGEE